MELRVLDKKQVETVYNERMVIDFPKNELKPLKTVIELMEKNMYEGLGLFDDDQMVAYTFVEKIGNNRLIDYLASMPEVRNRGLGAVLIEKIRDHLGSDVKIIGEVEDPMYEDDPDKKILQTRRLGFYKRNGCVDTGLRVICFKVPFIILDLNNAGEYDTDEIWEIYQEFYRVFLKPEIFEKNVLRG